MRGLRMERPSSPKTAVTSTRGRRSSACCSRARTACCRRVSSSRPGPGRQPARLHAGDRRRPGRRDRAPHHERQLQRVRRGSAQGRADVVGPGPARRHRVAGRLARCGRTATTNISGNNVNAYLDADANNAADAWRHGVTNGDFLTDVPTCVQSPSTAQQPRGRGRRTSST